MHRWANYEEWLSWYISNNIGDKALAHSPVLRLAFESGREQANPITVTNNHEDKK